MPAADLPASTVEGELDRLYANRFGDREREAKARLWQTLYDAYFHRFVPADGVVVDLGAGYCEFINCVRARRRLAVDLNPATVLAAAKGVEVHETSLEHLGAVIEHSSVDLAFASNVFEHLRSPDALLVVLEAVRAVLRPGGKLIVLQPNVRLVGGTFWDFFDHTLPLTEKGMAEALRIAGFSIEQSRAGFLPYTTKSRLPQWAWLVRAYVSFRPIQRLFGKQMLIVASTPVG